MFPPRTLPIVKYMINTINENKWFPNQAGDIANLVAIFATVIYSYPGYEWGSDTNTNIFMLAQVYNMYTNGREPPKQAGVEEENLPDIEESVTDMTPFTSQLVQELTLALRNQRKKDQKERDKRRHERERASAISGVRYPRSRARHLSEEED